MVGATVEVVDVVKDASAEVTERETEKGPQSSAELSLEGDHVWNGLCAMCGKESRDLHGSGHEERDQAIARQRLSLGLVAALEQESP